MDVIYFLTNIVPLLSISIALTWKLGRIEKHLSDNIKDLKIELITQTRDRLHQVREEQNKIYNLLLDKIDNIDDRIDQLEKDDAVTKLRLENIEKCLENQGVCKLKP